MGALAVANYPQAAAAYVRDYMVIGAVVVSHTVPRGCRAGKAGRYGASKARKSVDCRSQHHVSSFRSFAPADVANAVGVVAASRHQCYSP